MGTAQPVANRAGSDEPAGDLAGTVAGGYLSAVGQRQAGHQPDVQFVVRSLALADRLDRSANGSRRQSGRQGETTDGECEDRLRAYSSHWPLRAIDQLRVDSNRHRATAPAFGHRSLYEVIWRLQRQGQSDARHAQSRRPASASGVDLFG